MCRRGFLIDALTLHRLGSSFHQYSFARGPSFGPISLIEMEDRRNNQLLENQGQTLAVQLLWLLSVQQFQIAHVSYSTSSEGKRTFNFSTEEHGELQLHLSAEDADRGELQLHLSAEDAEGRGELLFSTKGHEETLRTPFCPRRTRRDTENFLFVRGGRGGTRRTAKGEGQFFWLVLSFW